MSEQKKESGDFTACPHWGKGGRYVVDITNGRRVPVADEQEPIPAEAEESKEAPAPAGKSTKR